MMLVDSHAHLEGNRFDGDRDEVIERAVAAGIGTILTVGQVGKDWTAMDASIALAETNDRVVTSIGLHPHDARFYSDAVGARMLETARHPRVVAWGECGLDYYYDNSPRDQQLEAFRAQLRLSRLAGLPVIIHSRDAADDTLTVVDQELGVRDNSGVFHCFSYDASVAAAAVALGFLVSFSGIVTFPTATEVRDAARVVPMDRILVETDSPFLAPVPYRGRRNEPAFVARVAEEVALLRGVALDELAAATTANFRRLFLSV